jgi:hypothetical protein
LLLGKQYSFSSIQSHKRRRSRKKSIGRRQKNHSRTIFKYGNIIETTFHIGKPEGEVFSRTSALLAQLAEPEEGRPGPTASESESDADDAKHDEPPAKESRRSVLQEQGTVVLQVTASATGKKPRA